MDKVFSVVCRMLTYCGILSYKYIFIVQQNISDFPIFLQYIKHLNDTRKDHNESERIERRAARLEATVTVFPTVASCSTPVPAALTTIAAPLPFQLTLHTMFAITIPPKVRLRKSCFWGGQIKIYIKRTMDCLIHYVWTRELPQAESRAAHHVHQRKLLS